MVPLWAPLTLEDTLAVNVTLWPATDGFRFDAKVVVVATALTFWFSGLEVLPVKFESPLYVAVMECEPPLRAVAEVVKLATPPERTAEPI